MAESNGNQAFTNAAWAVWEPLIEEVRPHGKTSPKELRRTLSAILWRHQNGAKWRSILAELGPWWMAVQLFIRWSKAGVWERLLELVQQRGVALGMTFLGGSNIRAHHKAAGAEKGGAIARSEISTKHLAALAAAMAPRLAGSPMGAGEPSPLLSHQVRRMNCRSHLVCSTAYPTCQGGSLATAAMPLMPSASGPGIWAHVLPFRPSARMRRSPVPLGSTTIDLAWRTSGRASKNGALSPPATRRPPNPSSASSASQPPPIGSSSNRP